MSNEGGGSRDISHDKTLLGDLLPEGTLRSPDGHEDEAAHAARETVVESLSQDGVPWRGPADGMTQPPAGTSAPGLHAVDVGRVVAGKYELVRLLGQGGMGKVFKAAHLGLGVPVAVKVMHPEVAGGSDYVRRFRREAHAASLLSHPNVVRVLDFGEDDGTLYLVMEYLEGRSLTRFLAGLDAPPPLSQVAVLLKMLLDGLEVAHAFGIVHRDLKPDNVFLVDGPSGDLVLKVVDFGLAHVDDARDRGPTLTKQDVIAGTPEYMSPEQCRSLSSVGPSADLYSFGCLLTEMLQLRPPFTGSSAIEVLAKQMFTQPPPLTRPPGAEPVPPLLERLRLDLLSKAPEKRPKDAADIKARLREALSVEATLARLPTRKGDEPLGDRAARAPHWQGSEAAPQTTRTRPRAVGLLHLVHDPAGLTEEHETGLAVHLLEPVLLTSPSDLAGTALGVLVVDAGPRIDEAALLLAEVRRASPRCRVLVCAADLTTEKMNTLVAAGASDVLRYPVTADALARKLERLLRRGR